MFELDVELDTELDFGSADELEVLFVGIFGFSVVCDSRVSGGDGGVVGGVLDVSDEPISISF